MYKIDVHVLILQTLRAQISDTAHSFCQLVTFLVQ